MADDEPTPIGLLLFGFCMIVIIIGVIFEVVVLGLAFFAADKVSCNWLWCTFTTVRSTTVRSSQDTISHSDVHITQIITKDCFLNGVKVNCSDFDTS